MEIKCLQWRVKNREFQWQETPHHTVELSIDGHTLEFISKDEVDQLIHAWHLMHPDSLVSREKQTTRVATGLSSLNSQSKDPTAFPRKIRHIVITMVILCISILAYDVLLS